MSMLQPKRIFKGGEDSEPLCKSHEDRSLAVAWQPSPAWQLVRAPQKCQ
jgi:hypothetical protein